MIRGHSGQLQESYNKDSKVEVCRGGGRSTLNSGKKVAGGEGGEGRGVDRHWTQERKLQVGGEGRGGQSTHNLERIREGIARITSGNVDPGGGRSIDTKLGKDLRGHCKDYLWQCWSWGSINTQLGKDLRGHCKDYLWQCWSWGGQLTHNLERICEDIPRITTDNVDLGGAIHTQLGKDPWGHCKDYLWQCWSGGSIDTQLGKDLRGHCKDYLWQCWSWGCQLTHNLERICEDIARITSDNVDPGGGVNWHTTWKGSMRTLQGLPLTMLILGVNQHTTWKGSTRTLQGLPLTMLILGGQSTHNLERIHMDIARITSDNVDPGVGSIDTQLGKDLQGHCKDYLWQCWLGGQLTHNLERICEDIARITSDNVDPGGGGWLTHNLERIHEDIARITSDNVDPGVGVDWHTTLKGSARTLQGLPLTMLILGVNQHTTLKGSARTLQGLSLTMLILGGWSTHNLERIHEDIARITSDNVDPGGSIDTQLGKDPRGHCKDYLWQCWSRGVDWHTTWKGSARALQGLPQETLCFRKFCDSTCTLHIIMISLCSHTSRVQHRLATSTYKICHVH